jgi:four helix bundle protein
MKTEDLDVFKIGHEASLKIYKATSYYPEEEKFNLISQMRRASSSICMNLMEGSHRITKNEYKHFVSISRGSCGEIKYQLLLSKDLGYIDEKTYQELIELYERISMMLTKLYNSL